MTILVLSLYSCIHDDMLQNTTEYSSKEYISKSPWNEDEVYIKKVQQVFLKHANLQYFNNRYGEAYWDYSMSFGQFGERFALIPVVKENKVVLILEAIRKGKKLYFYEKTDENYLQFFNYLLFSPTSGYKETNSRQSTTAKLTYTCTTKTFIVECTDAMPNCTPLTSTLTNCELTGTGPSTPKASLEEPPMGGGGGSGDDGYEYPEPPVETPCEKTKQFFKDSQTKSKINELYAKSKIGGEKAFMTSADGTASSIIEGNEHSVELGDMTGFIGYSHNHTPSGIKMFSSNDIYTLFKLIANQPSGTPVNTAFGTMVAAQGQCMSGCPDNYLYFSYTMSYNGTLDEAQAIRDRNYTEDDLKKLGDRYSKFEASIKDKSEYASQNGNFMNFKGLEKIFYKALDNMGIDKTKMILQRVDKDGNVTNISLDAEGKTQETQCPN
mgnify:CR=1 FL=1